MVCCNVKKKEKKKVICIKQVSKVLVGGNSLNALFVHSLLFCCFSSAGPRKSPSDRVDSKSQYLEECSCACEQPPLPLGG